MSSCSRRAPRLHPTLFVAQGGRRTKNGGPSAASSASFFLLVVNGNGEHGSSGRAHHEGEGEEANHRVKEQPGEECKQHETRRPPRILRKYNQVVRSSRLLLLCYVDQGCTIAAEMCEFADHGWQLVLSSKLGRVYLGRIMSRKRSLWQMRSYEDLKKVFSWSSRLTVLKGILLCRDSKNIELFHFDYFMLELGIDG